MNNISLVILAKNEERSISSVIQSAVPFVEEIILVDDHSADTTREKALVFGAHIVLLPFSIEERGFAATASFMLQQGTRPWILILDADEIINEGDLLRHLVSYTDKTAWALPRRKWLNWSQRLRTEYEAYPDWQTRLLRRNPAVSFVGQMHIRFQGAPVYKAYRGPHIEHLQKECRDEFKLSQRPALYATLAAQQKVTIDGGFPLAQ